MNYKEFYEKVDVKLLKPNEDPKNFYNLIKIIEINWG